MTASMTALIFIVMARGHCEWNVLPYLVAYCEYELGFHKTSSIEIATIQSPPEAYVLVVSYWTKYRRSALHETQDATRANNGNKQ